MYFVTGSNLVLQQPSTAVLAKTKADITKKSLGVRIVYAIDCTKGGFFSKSVIRFFKSPNLQKKIFQKNYPKLEN